MILLLTLLIILLIAVAMICCTVGLGTVITFIVVADVITSISVLIWIIKKFF